MGLGVPYIHWCSEQTGSSTITFNSCYGSTYVTCLTRDYFVRTWLLNGLEEKISGSVMFLPTAKEMWDTLNVMYGNEKNPSRVFEIYECLF